MFQQARSMRILVAVTAAMMAISQATLVADATTAPALLIDAVTTPAASEPGVITDVDGTTFFFACDGSRHMALFTTDGTDPGTARLKTVGQCGPGGSYDDAPIYDVDAIAVGTRLMFSVRQAAQFHEKLWVSDGTPGGTDWIDDEMDSIDNLTDVDGTLYFSERRGLWKSDGTYPGTQLLESTGFIHGIVGFDGAVYYIDRQARLRTTDGTPGSAVAVTGVNGVQSMLVANGTLFLVRDTGSGPSLWASDGSSAGTHLVKDIDPGANDRVHSLVVVGTQLFFVAQDAQHGQELWRTDGTTLGTKMVKDILAAGSSKPTGLIAVGTSLFFAARDATHGRALWKSDGTKSGTTFVKAVVPANACCQPDGPVAVGSTLYFGATGPGGQELWISDGTAIGTHEVTDINGGGDADPLSLAASGGRAFFGAEDGIHGRELWVSDGSESGTTLVSEIDAADRGSEPRSLGRAGDGAVFLAGERLYVTDGTPTGTALIEDASSVGTELDHGQNAASLGGVLYFTADDGVHGVELWRSDGTHDGTAMAIDVTTGSADTIFDGIASDGSHLYFVTHDASDAQLWVSDGSTASVLRSFSSSEVFGLTKFGGSLLFWADHVHYTYGVEEHEYLWRTDGTVSGTVRVSSTDFLGYVRFGPLTAAGNRAYFVVADTELWSTDGTGVGTKRVKALPYSDGGVASLTVSAGRLFFTSGRYDDGAQADVPQLWTSTGSAASTKMLGEFPMGYPPMDLTAMGGKLYFFAGTTVVDATSYAYSLWTSDGTSAGTVHASAKAFQAPASASRYIPNPSSLTNVGGTLYFAGQAHPFDANGIEVWSSDGTDAGTAMLVDMDPNGSSIPANFVKVGTNLVFSADDGAHGTEMFGMPMP